MKALVIYDSFFGNTEQIAQALGTALGSLGDADTIQVDRAQPERIKGLDILIVGSPTRGFRPTPAIVGFLKAIPTKGLKGMKVAAFDTRISTSDIKSSALRFLVTVGGYAAKHIADRLEKKGGRLTIPPEGFFVTGEKGPLKEGELERAAVWAIGILAG